MASNARIVVVYSARLQYLAEGGGTVVAAAAPIDPRYVAFKGGFYSFIVDKEQYPLLRFAPGVEGGKWIAYVLNKYEYVDFGISGPASPLKPEVQRQPKETVVWKWKDFSFGFNIDEHLPPVFASVLAGFDAHKARYPIIAWNPYDGSWRGIRQLSGAPTDPGDPTPKPPPNGELQRRLDELQALLRAGEITDEIFKIRVLELLREYG